MGLFVVVRYPDRLVAAGQLDRGILLFIVLLVCVVQRSKLVRSESLDICVIWSL